MGVVTLLSSNIEVDDGDSGHLGGDNDDFAPGPMPTVSPGPSRRTRAFARARSGTESAIPSSYRPSSSQGGVVPGHITQFSGLFVHHRTVAGLVEHTFQSAVDPSISYTDSCTHVSHFDMLYLLCTCAQTLIPFSLCSQVPVDEVSRLSSYFQASKAHLVETCDSWRQAHNFLSRMIADLRAQLAAVETPAGGGSGGQTSRQHTEDRTEGQPIGGEAEESDEDDEDVEDETEEDDE